MLLKDLERHLIERGPRPCLVHCDNGAYRVLTFADFADLSDRLATAVRRLARQTSSGVVLLFLKHHVLQLPLFVGCMKAGLVPCFLPFPSAKQDPDLYWQTHAAVIARCEPALIVAYGELLESVAAIAAASGAPVCAIETLGGETRAATAALPPYPDEDSIALLQHSSGTTGLKKGVALTYGQIARQTRAYAPAAGLDETSIVASWLPYYHDMGLFAAFLIPLSAGAAIVSLDAFEWVRQPWLLLDLVERFQATHCWLPNFAFAHIANTAPTERAYDLSSLKAIVSCSEPVKASTLDTFFGRFEAYGADRAKVKACYAMAETCFAVSQTAIGEECEIFWYDEQRLDRDQRAVRREPGCAGARPFVSNGAPLSGIDVRILPAVPAPPGEQWPGVPVGEIEVRGECVFDGYFANEEATRAAFRDGWYKTGDIGFVDGGRLFVSGRKKDILIVHGRNYYAHDIEAAAALVPGVFPGRVVALGITNEASGSEDAVILAETDAPAETHGALRREIKQHVHGALELMPARVALVPRGSLIKTTSGKISRSENLTRYVAETAVETV